MRAATQAAAAGAWAPEAYTNSIFSSRHQRASSAPHPMSQRLWKKLPFPEGMDFHSSQAVAEVPRKCENSMRMTEKKRHELMCRTGSGRAYPCESLLRKLAPSMA